MRGRASSVGWWKPQYPPPDQAKSTQWIRAGVEMILLRNPSQTPLPFILSIRKLMPSISTKHCRPPDCVSAFQDREPWAQGSADSNDLSSKAPTMCPTYLLCALLHLCLWRLLGESTKNEILPEISAHQKCHQVILKDTSAKCLLQGSENSHANVYSGFAECFLIKRVVKWF